MFFLDIYTTRSLDGYISLANRYIFHGELEKIIEVTYSYRHIGNDMLLNETLFEEFTGFSLDTKSLATLKKISQKKLRSAIALISKISQKVEKIPIKSRNESLRRGLFLDSLEYVKQTLEMALLGIDFEAEKGGLVHDLSPKQINETILAIESREANVFGQKIAHLPKEFSFCYNFIVANHDAKKKKLSPGDTRKMNAILKKLKAGLGGEILETPAIVKKYKRGTFMKIEIPRKDYRKIFDSVCEMYRLPQRTKITNAGSIYDGDEFLEIPRAQTHATFSIEKILGLLSHEIEAHYINSYNGHILLGKFRGAKNLPKEEGLAKFMEKIFDGYTYENMDSIIEGFFTILAGEILSGEEFQDFMRIMAQEYHCKRDAQSSIERAKRNYSFDFPGVQHKDVVYFRGLTKTTEYLKNGGAFWKLFLGKVGFDDIENLHDIHQLSDRKDELIFPVFLSDLIYYYLGEKQNNPEFRVSIPEYYLYLKRKYWFLDIEMFQIIDHLKNEWKNIEKILKLFEKYII